MKVEGRAMVRQEGSTKRVTVAMGEGGPGGGAHVGGWRDRWRKWQWMELKVAEVTVGVTVLEATTSGRPKSFPFRGRQVPVPSGPNTVRYSDTS